MFTVLFLCALASLPRIQKLPPPTDCYPTQAELDTDAKTVAYKAHTSYGTCACDVSNSCDPNCCCDPDCPNNTFSTCLPEKSRDSDRIQNEWGLRMCTDPESTERRGSIVDWFMRTMLCIHKDNNPVLGDFYDVYQANIPASYESVNVLDKGFSFMEAFHEAATTMSPTLSPDLFVTGAVRRGANGECVFSDNNVKYLEHVSETCILSEPNVFSSQECTTGGCPSTWTYTMACKQSGSTIDCQKQDVSMGSDLVGVGETVHVTVNWDINETADTNSIAKRGYEFGDIIETTSGDFQIFVPGQNGQCTKEKTTSLKFGDDIEVSCVYGGDMVDGNNTEVLTQATADMLAMAEKHKSIWAAPQQSGLQNGAVEVHDVAGYTYDNAIKKTMVENIIEQYTFWYKQVGTKSNPQKIIEHVDRRYYFAEQPFDILDCPVEFMKKTKISTHVKFFEIPNDMNMKIASDVNLAAQSWLPF